MAVSGITQFKGQATDSVTKTSGVGANNNNKAATNKASEASAFKDTDNLTGSTGGFLYKSNTQSSKLQVETNNSSGASSEDTKDYSGQIARAASMQQDGEAQKDAAQGDFNSLNSGKDKFHGDMNNTNASMNAGTDLMGSKSNEMKKSGKILEANTAKQEKTLAWLNNCEPTLDEMNAEIDALMAEATQTIPEELGIDPEATLDEAIAQLNEMIDEEKLEELNRAQERSSEIAEQLEGMEEDDPERDALTTEQEGLQTILTDPDNQTMLQASAALSVLADYTDAIGAIEEAKAGVSAEVQEKTADINKVDESSKEESGNVKSATKLGVSTFDTIQQDKGDTDQQADNFMVACNVVKTVGTVLQTAGSIMTSVGTTMLAATPTAPAGFALMGAGFGVQIFGFQMQGVAGVCQGIHTGDTGMIAGSFVQAFTGIGGLNSISSGATKTSETTNKATENASNKAAKITIKTAPKSPSTKNAA